MAERLEQAREEPDGATPLLECAWCFFPDPPGGLASYQIGAGDSILCQICAALYGQTPTGAVAWATNRILRALEQVAERLSPDDLASLRRPPRKPPQ